MLNSTEYVIARSVSDEAIQIEIATPHGIYRERSVAVRLAMTVTRTINTLTDLELKGGK